MKRLDFLYYTLLVPLDFFMLVLAGLLAYFLRLSEYAQSFRPVIFNLPLKSYLEIVFLVAPAWIIIFALLGLYKMRSRSALEEFLQIISASSLAFMVVVLYIFLSHEWFESRFIILAGWGFGIFSVYFGRLMARAIKKYLAGGKGSYLEKTLIIGSNALLDALLKDIKRYPFLGYKIAGQMNELDFPEINRLIATGEVSHIISSSDNLKNGSFVELMHLCADKNVQFKFIPSEFQARVINYDIETLSGIPLIAPCKTALGGWGKVGKHIFDFIFALLGVIVMLPVFIIVGLIIKINSEGPAFVRLKRVTKGQEFYLYKFRSMVRDAHGRKKELLDLNERKDGPLFKMKDDPRVTSVGKFIRKYRVDELPQLFNVLSGEMSLVGPRPHEPEEIAQYKPHQKKLLAIKAGITGLAQISGSSDLPFEEEVKLDVFYIENWSFLFDLKIILKTIIVLFTDKSAC